MKIVNTNEMWPDGQKPKYLAMDLETTGLCVHTDSIVNCAFYFNDQAYYTEIADVMREVAGDPNIAKIFHNAVFDASMLKTHDIKLQGPIHDTMVLAHVLDCNDPGSLKDLSVQYLGPDAIKCARALWAWLDENKKKKCDMHTAPDEILQAYVCEDAENTYKLFELYRARMKKLRKWMLEQGGGDPVDYYKEEGQKLIPVLVDMHVEGVRVDLTRASKKKAQLLKKQKQLFQQLNVDAKKDLLQACLLLHAKKTKQKESKNKSGKLKKPLPAVEFNWGSNAHLQTLFFQVWKTKPLKRTEKGNPSVDEEFLRLKADEFPVLKHLLNYRKMKKLISTYLEPPLEKNIGSRIHANIRITGTDTGRFSCDNPNLQNLIRMSVDEELDGPTDVKSIYRPGPGNVFLYADYSQLELRIAAHLSRDPLLLEAYNEGKDLHEMTRQFMQKTLGEAVTREQAKRVNFAIIYNASGFRVAQILGLMAASDEFRDKCKCGMKIEWKTCPYHSEVSKAAKWGDRIIEELFGKYQGLKKYLDKQLRFMTKYKVNMSDFGRIRRLPDLRIDPRAPENKRKYKHAIKAGFNHRIQSFGASVTKRAMVKLHEMSYKVRNQVHDALYYEVSTEVAEEKCQELKTVMEGITTLRVPLIAEPKILNSFNEGDIYA